MTLGAWTKGRWRLSRTMRYVMDGHGAPWIAEVSRRPEALANARLLVSAPDLYEALFGLYNYVAATRFEVDAGSPPILRDGLYDQTMRAAALALHRATEGDATLAERFRHPPLTQDQT